MNAHISKSVSSIAQSYLGNDQAIYSLIAAFLSPGHVLLEDTPGVGKTHLAKAFARVLGQKYKRIQCTPDLLPSDILGTTVYKQAEGNFEFIPGPIFTNILLVDEINRATPRTQSALLEAMAEGRVSIDGKTYVLPDPFFVIATQNPIEFEGTFPLPEAQLDRFLITMELGRANRETELSLISKALDGTIFSTPEKSHTTPFPLAELRSQLAEVHCSPVVQHHIIDLVSALNENVHVVMGLSPRASMGLALIARAWAFCHGQNFVDVEDVRRFLGSVARSRLVLKADSEIKGITVQQLCDQALEQVTIPLSSEAK